MTSSSNEPIETLMQPFRAVLNTDYEKYKNHVCRVFLNCLLIDNNEYNRDKYAVAAVFHDIGIWSDQTIDYLDPSIARVKSFLTESGKPEWIEEISMMIYWHHKTSVYRGKYQATIETFRKADWIDVSMGILHFGVSRQTLKGNRHVFPNLGFHWFLVKKIAVNFVKHPLHPLPMFKR